MSKTLTCYIQIVRQLIKPPKLYLMTVFDECRFSEDSFPFLFQLPLVVCLLCKVSTKSGLDPSGVWQAWGMASLMAGNLSGAREKFARCLKPPVDRNQLNLGPLLLQEVVQHLETHIQPTLATVGRNIMVALEVMLLLPFRHNAI